MRLHHYEVRTELASGAVLTLGLSQPERVTPAQLALMALGRGPRWYGSVTVATAILSPDERLVTRRHDDA